LRVVNSAGRQPLIGASVTWNVTGGKTNTLSVDARGRTTILVPGKASGTLRVTAGKAGFAPMTMSWDTAKVPAGFELALPQGQRLGGRMIDEAGAPVAGANVALVFPQRLAGARVAVDERPLTTDTNGSWQCDFVPKDAAYVRVEVTHPDFDSQDNDVSIDDLATGKAQFRMVSVIRVRGRVLDDAGKPVPAAEVVLGREREIWPGSSTLETTTDAEGRFEFQRVHFQKRLLGVKAEGSAPALLVAEVKRDLPQIDVRLTRGEPLRVRVVDNAGKPISRVQVNVDEWPSSMQAPRAGVVGRWSYPGWEWETDAEGRFVWSNAPPDAISFTFNKGGYMSRSRHALRPSPEEQTVILGPSFRIRGSVTDAQTSNAVPEFIVNVRYVEVQTFNGNSHTNFGAWSEYNRKRFAGGQFDLVYDHPLLYTSRGMHDWQFRVEADGYEPALSRVVPDAERGTRLEFKLKPQPLPELAAAPTAAKRITAGVAVQPASVHVGEAVALFVKARLAPGFHIYALEDSGCKNLPTSIEFSLSQGLRMDGSWRGPEPREQDDGSRTLAGDMLFRRSFVIEQGARIGKHTLPVQLHFQVCNEALCWPPETISLETEFEVLASGR
jgi:uncharacterized GH25 family protein